MEVLFSSAYWKSIQAAPFDVELSEELEEGFMWTAH